MSHFRLFAAVTVAVLAGNLLTCAADAPKVERVVPPGGQRGTTVEVKLPGKPGDSKLQVWSEYGQLQFEFSEKNDTAKVIVPADAAFGLHQLRFFNEHGSTELLPFEVGSIAEVVEAEPNNRVDEAQALESLPITINGVLQKSGDADLYAVTLNENETFIASVSANRTLGSPVDTVTQLLNESGTVVAQNDDDHGMDSQIVFEVKEQGTYYLRIFGFPATPNSTIKLAGAATYIYRLTLTTGPFIDHCMPAKLLPTADSKVTLHGWNFADAVPVVQVKRFEGNSTTIGDVASLPYTINTTSLSSFVESDESPQVITIPSATTGVISSAGEKDVYSFTGTKNQKVTVEAVSSEIFSPLDPTLTIDAADGKRVKDVDDGTRKNPDARTDVKLPKDGEYRLTVEDLFGNGGERFVYVLSVQETRPDFSLKLQANMYVLNHDKELDIPVTVTRTNGFNEKISVSTKGLPEGVVAEAVDSESKGDSAKSVTLKIKNGGGVAAFSGPIGISGTAEEGSLVRNADAPIQNSTATTSQIWLTVIAAPAPKEEIPSAEESKADVPK